MDNTSNDAFWILALGLIFPWLVPSNMEIPKEFFDIYDKYNKNLGVPDDLINYIEDLKTCYKNKENDN